LALWLFDFVDLLIRVYFLSTLKRAKADFQAKDKILRIAQAKLAKAKLDRDFGGKHGICCGKIERVDLTTRRPLYNCVYTDGDKEDYDDGELQYAIDLHFAFKARLTIEPLVNEEKGTLRHL
jgi:hypothetical protein